jgi:cytochrome c biogenesis protein CcmG/thiol:disulfide interchange protein DsbE
MPPAMVQRLATRQRPTWLNTALVLALATVVGLAVLPRLKPGSARFVGQEAPDFVLPVIHGGDPGNRLRLSDLRGRVVVIDFWASSCSACREQAPILNAVARRSGPDQVTVVGVNVQDVRDEAVRFARAQSLKYPTVLDEDSQVAVAYEVTSLPLMAVVGRAGRITAIRQGLVAAHELDELLQEALAGGPAAR